MFQFNVSWTELESLRFFEMLSKIEKQDAAAALSPLNFSQGDLIFKEGDASDTCYILMQGEVEIVRQLPNGMGYSFGTLGRGDVFGEMCLLTTKKGQKRSATAVARSNGLAFRLYRGMFDRALEEGDMWAYKIALGFARVLAARLDAIDSVLVDWIARPEGGEMVPIPEPEPPEEPEAEAPQTDFDRLREQLRSILR